MTDQKRLTKAKKSRYAKKIARKLGRGRVSPGWMWWLERSAWSVTRTRPSGRWEPEYRDMLDDQRPAEQRARECTAEARELEDERKKAEDP